MPKFGVFSLIGLKAGEFYFFGAVATGLLETTPAIENIGFVMALDTSNQRLSPILKNPTTISLGAFAASIT